MPKIQLDFLGERCYTYMEELEMSIGPQESTQFRHCTLKPDSKRSKR